MTRPRVRVAASQDQLDWLRDPETREGWGRRCARLRQPPRGFDPARAADQIEASAARIVVEKEQTEPLLFCNCCGEWTRHRFKGDEAVRADGSVHITAYRHLYDCTACRRTRVWGLSATLAMQRSGARRMRAVA